ncbi:putative F-box/LRR-repeat protein 23 [Cardamine amara subsp. amara]|uniref:F-box/LRR-repeat protein 23 n=1 Tax=Cardamine amara subsp. amara TaxID=228776 RepID=A0ABD0Z312_CARAN
MVCDDDALAIDETMPQLVRLELFGNRLTNIGLNAILDNCHHLEHLDLRCCSNIEFVGDLKKRCSERIKDLKLPDDSDPDSPVDDTFSDLDS